MNDCGIRDSKNLTFGFADSRKDVLKKTIVYLTGREIIQEDNRHSFLFPNDKTLVSVKEKERLLNYLLKIMLYSFRILT